MKYQELKEGIGRRLNSAAEDFFTVGYYLRQISERALFLEDCYESIWDFAKSEFNLSPASASRFMAINSKFSIDGGRTMEPKYIGMGVSKLQEMLTLPDEDLERVTKETTVREIRAMKAAKKKPLSFFGWPETERPEPPQIIDADAADYMEIGDRPQDTATGPAVPACEPLKAEPEEVPAEEPKAPTEAQEPPQEPLQEPEAPAEAQEPEAPTEVEKPWRRYTASDVRMILQDAKFDLEQYEDVQTESIRTNTPQLPLKMMRKQQIIVDALSALCDRMAAFDEFIREGREEADDE